MLKIPSALDSIKGDENNNVCGDLNVETDISPIINRDYSRLFVLGHLADRFNGVDSLRPNFPNSEEPLSNEPTQKMVMF